MEQFVDVTNFETWQLWLVAAVGLLLILAGYRVKKVAFFVLWFVVGYMLMGYVMPVINSSMPEVAESSL